MSQANQMHSTRLLIYLTSFRINQRNLLGSDYFTENFQVEENKTKTEKYSSALFLFAFQGLR